MHRTLLAMSLLLLACSSDDDAESDAGTDASVPEDAGATSAPGDRATSLMLDGTAEAMAEDGADRVECSFYGTIDQIVHEANGDFTGLIAGEAFRTTYAGDGMFEFIPLIGGPVSLTHTGHGEVELRFVGDQPDDAIEFWLELEVITGVNEGDDHYAGTWNCAPGLLGDPGFMDIDLTAPGTWTLQPAP